MKNNNPGLKLSNSNNYNHSTTEDIKFSLEELLTGQVGGDDSPEYHDFSGASTILDASQSAVYSTILNPPTATINVNYYGFSEAAKNAFEYAVNIWEGWIKSDIAIEVDAYWEDLSQYGSNILGAASPNGFRSNFAGATQNDTSYVMSLANHLAGKDLNGDGAEIKVWLNSSFNNWYLATDGKPGNKYDFTTVVLHELGHGFGITDLINSSGTGTYGTTIYERFIVNGDNQSLDTFFNNSSELKTQLRSNDLFFNGKNAVEANGGEQVKLYAPGKWQYGSSIAHLDEATYSKGNPDALMTPELRAGEVIHNPGGITLGVLEDLGWDINQADTQSQIPQPQETQLPQSQETQSPQTIINFQDGEISSYVAQDDSKSVVNTIENNQGLEIINNGWKKFDFNYQVTKDTILEFEFNSLVKGEIQAIGLETNSKFDVNSDKGRIFQLEGKDNFGITDFKQDVTGKGWQTYQIKLSDYFSQDININYLLFANDHDNGSKNAHSQWKNLRVYEQNQQNQPQPQAPVETQTSTETQPQPQAPVETQTQTSSEIPSINFQDGEISSYVAQDDSKSVVNTIENNQGLEII
ncbi:MAG: hypothetical protein KI793_31005, partial [Rivularia sp. (in: Bacteria)]|nr:hypothetical protein [Rivularia sp. MS3]